MNLVKLLCFQIFSEHTEAGQKQDRSRTEAGQKVHNGISRITHPHVGLGNFMCSPEVHFFGEITLKGVYKRKVSLKKFIFLQTLHWGNPLYFSKAIFDSPHPHVILRRSPRIFLRQITTPNTLTCLFPDQCR